MYADDIVLPSPTASGTRTLLHLCDVLLMIFSVFFNSAGTIGRPGGTLPVENSGPTRIHEAILVVTYSDTAVETWKSQEIAH